jgi:hypothetical protein|tara:strand:- start:503 stop:775 length:273 start_codon:yes stop_codon:yes gene_type:complete
MVFIADMSRMETTDYLEIILSELNNAKIRGRKSNNYKFICDYLMENYNVGLFPPERYTWNFEANNKERIYFVNTMCAGSIRNLFYDMISM